MSNMYSPNQTSDSKTYEPTAGFTAESFLESKPEAPDFLESKPEAPVSSSHSPVRRMTNPSTQVIKAEAPVSSSDNSPASTMTDPSKVIDLTHSDDEEEDDTKPPIPAKLSLVLSASMSEREREVTDLTEENLILAQKTMTVKESDVQDVSK